ncbi:MAG: hypothetical protein GF392_03650 [Candidatus Omnitrophica bacterium]|nr:hypothetical protein [Candidatus Omnitrophota bacterium]
MMKDNERPAGITIFSVALILFGVYNLLGVGSYGDFAAMFSPLPAVIVVPLYMFTVLYGICAVYCGSRMLKLEDWARKVMVVMTSISVILGLALNRTVMANFKQLMESGKIEVPPELTGSVYTYIVAAMAAATIFELAVVFYFTRSGVAEAFE